ncbi:Crp/Fnr family transcriptional regulator [Antarcticirhabdus aurantiaca]|uniref:Crp/Fnr family transcriptional regulator n=1 Tax=Antarcticirhabdus aurantiaca TaxID=2606717 RepID=A0ACD4NS10_9HYPH|nr:Crp/Fnr family transcriptional regulator [Antarcticirhabdus aurantiaca]WAJ29503.1 Crp/Fnr family transcriptional regulator [Jeongeuplla avenae]
MPPSDTFRLSGEPAPPLPRHCTSCLSYERGACGVLTPDQLRRLAATALRRRFPPGSQILPPTRAEDLCASLVSGVAKLSCHLEGGRQQIVALATAPSIVAAPFADRDDTRAVAATEVDVCLLRRSTLEDLARENHALEHELHESSLADLRDARELLVTLGRKSARERVAWFLLFMRQRHCRTEEPAPEGSVIELPLSRGDIADFLGLTIETVSRQFSQLKNEGAITVPDGRRFSVRDLRQLEAAAGRA